ncbi:hypothetical protein J6590_063764 [Homalodisca vitripennis]|nr:hypothetical protein J6590_063764 [Homalodisca vitripennis]
MSWGAPGHLPSSSDDEERGSHLSDVWVSAHMAGPGPDTVVTDAVTSASRQLSAKQRIFISKHSVQCDTSGGVGRVYFVKSDTNLSPLPLILHESIRYRADKHIDGNKNILAPIVIDVSNAKPVRKETNDRVRALTPTTPLTHD